MSELAAIFAPDFLLRNALYAGVIVGLVCPVVGLYFIMRRMIFLGVALPQVAGAGIALAYFLHSHDVHFLPHETEEHWMALVGSVVLTAATLVVLALLERRRVGFTEGRIAAAFVVASGGAILLVAASPQGEASVLSLLTGEIVAVSDGRLAIMVVGYAAVMLALVACYREFLLVSYDRDTATALGRRSTMWDAALFAVIGLAISLGVMTVGPLVVFAMLVIPPLAAMRLVRGMVVLSITAAMIGAASSVIGFVVSYRSDLPLGPTDAVVVAAVLAVVAMVRRR